MDGARPAIIVASPTRDDPEALPSTDVVLEAAIDGLATDGWGREQATDFIIDVREGNAPIQFPSMEPAEWPAVVVVFDQSEATFPFGFDGPFRLAMRGIHEALPDLDLYVDAVPPPGAEP